MRAPSSSGARIPSAGLARRTFVAPGLLLLVIGASFMVVLLAIEDERDTSVWVRHSEQVLEAANRLEQLVIDLELGQRSFVTTGDERFLRPWNAARAAFPQQAERLEQIATAHSVEHGRRAGRIKRAGISYIVEYSVPTVEAARRDRASVLTVAVTEEGSRRVGLLRDEFDTFRAFANELAATRHARARSATDRMTFAAGFGVAGSVLFVVLFTRYLTGTRSMRLFVATASHDLRSSLATILGFAESLERDGMELSDQQRAQSASAILRSARQALRLVDDLLMLSKLESGGLDVRPERVVLRSALDAAVKESAPDATVTCDEEIAVWADPDHLHRMLVNYLSNAVRYGAPPVEVSVAAGDRIEIRVLDSGDGVPADFVDKLFTSFARADHVKREASGLGLSIVKGLAKANGGEVFYETRATGGSCFGLRLVRDHGIAHGPGGG